MAARQMTRVAGIMALLALGACGEVENPILMNAAAQETTPDEFGIVPTKPLQMPDSLAALPEPAAAGPDRVDPRPRADVARALGGDPARAVAPGRPDGGIVNHASRYGRDSEIRDVLAAQDLQFRRDNNGRLLERLFSVNTYHDAYRFMALDQYAELERWRRAGARTPTVPPEGAQD